MSHKLRVAILGYGIMGRLHRQAVAQHPMAEVVAVAARSEANRARALADGVPAAYADWEALLKAAQPDAVIVALPDRLHAAPVMASLRAGCDVLVEKPMAATHAEALAMQATARETGRRLMANFSFRWEADFQLLKQKLDAGELGAPQYLYVRVSDSIVVPTQWLAWAGESSPTEFLLPHAVDLVRWLTGREFVEVFARQSTGVLAARGIPTHDTLVAVCKLEGGATVCLETSWILPASHSTVVDFHVEVQGAAGMARLDRKQTGIELFTEAGATAPITWLSTLANGRGRGFFYEAVENFLDCLTRPETVPLSTARDGVANAAVLEALLASARTGCPVAPPAGVAGEVIA